MILDGLSEDDRYVFLSAFVHRFDQALALQFPTAQGYQISSGGGLHWSITRGRFCGLQVDLGWKDTALKALDLQFDSFFPVVQNGMEPTGRFLGRWDEIGGPARWILGHVFVPLLIIPVMLLLPLLALYRLALLFRTAEAEAAMRLLDTILPELQASRAGRIVLIHQRSPALNYALYLAAAGAATVGCFWLSDMEGSWSTLLFIAGILLALLSLVLLIATVLASLGFDTGK